MSIPLRAQAAVIGYSAPHLRAAYSGNVFFGDGSAINRKDDIPPSVKFICLGPNVVPGHRNRIKSCASSLHVPVPVYEDGEAALEGRLQLLSQATMPSGNGHRAIVVVGLPISGVEQEKYIRKGVVFMDAESIHGADDVPNTTRLIGVASEHWEVITSLFKHTDIPVRKVSGLVAMREILDKELGNGSHPDPAPSPASQRSAGGSKNKFTSLGLKPLVEFVADHLGKSSADVHEIAKRAGYDTTRSSVEQAIGRARGLKRQAAVTQTSPTVDRQREASGVSPVQQIGTIVAQLNVLGKEIEQLQSLNSDLEARNGELDARNADLKEQNARLQREAADLPKMREEIARLKKEAAEVPVLRRQLEKATALGQQLANLKT